VLIVPDTEGRGVPWVQVTLPTDSEALTIADRLRRGPPSVRVDCSRAPQGCLVLVPTCLKAADAEPIAAAFAAALKE
jgi:hypothetical protein